MTDWADEEIRELINQWPTASAAQIAKRLHRTRSAVCGKAKQLRDNGVLPPTGAKHYDVNPRQRQGGADFT